MNKKFIFYIIFALVLAACNQNSSYLDPEQSNKNEIIPQVVTENENIQISENVILPPWQRWIEINQTDSRLYRIDELVQSFKILKSINEYERLLSNDISNSELILTRLNKDSYKKAVFSRLIGNILKTGNSKLVLKQTAKFLKDNNISIKSTDPLISFIVSFAYREQKNYIQSLAWLKISLNNLNFNDQSISKLESSDIRFEISNTLSSISRKDIEKLEKKFKSDPQMLDFILKAKTRNLDSSNTSKDNIDKYFDLKTYNEKILVKQPSHEDINLETNQNIIDQSFPIDARIGVLLPFNEKYNLYSESIKNGIKLAAKENKLNLKSVFFENTNGDVEVAKNAYKKLVVENKVDFVLGPLLADTSLAIAELTNTYKVPNISFTKRDRVTFLSNFSFRLGSTAMDQVENIVSYSKNALNLNNIAIIYPNNEIGNEFYNYYKIFTNKYNLNNVSELQYSYIDDVSVVELNQLFSKNVEAIFIADSLENSYKILIKLSEIQTQQENISNGEFAPNLKDLKIFGPASWDDSVLLSGYGQTVEGVYFVSPYYNHSKRRQAIEFYSNFIENFNTSPDFLSAQSYDAMNLALKAITNSHKFAVDIDEILYSLKNIYSITGELCISESGEINRKMSIIKYINGQTHELSFAGENLN